MAHSFIEVASNFWRKVPFVARLIGLVAVLPLLLAVFGIWEYTQYNADSAETEQTQQYLQQLEQGVQEIRDNPRGKVNINGESLPSYVAIARLQKEITYVKGSMGKTQAVGGWVVPASAVVVLTGLLAALFGSWGVWAVRMAGKKALTSRDELLRLFVLWRQRVPAFLSTFTGLLLLCITALLVVRLAVAYEVVVLGNPSKNEVKLHAILLLLIGAVVYGGVMMLVALRKSLKVLENDDSEVMGISVSRQEAPLLWQYVDELAQKVGASTPAHIVVGMTDCFYVTAHPMELVPSKKKLQGETMYLPLTYLTLMHRDEIDAVLSHELGHFAGADTAYSLGFTPQYQGLVANLQAIYSASGGDHQIDLLNMPATSFVEYVLEQFDLAVKYFSRQREFAADQAAASVAGGGAVARGLVRITALQDVIGQVIADISRRPHEAGTDLIAMLMDALQKQGLTPPDLTAEAATSHPTDTHPPTLERAKAVGYPINDELVQAALSAPDAGALEWVRALFADSQKLQSQLLNEFKGAAAEHNTQVKNELEAVASKAVNAQSIYQSHHAVWIMSGFAVLMILVFVGLFVALMGQKVMDKELMWATPIVFLGAVGFAWGAWLAYQRTQIALMELNSEGMVFPKWPRPVSWGAIQDYNCVITNDAHIVMTFTMEPNASDISAPDNNMRRVLYKPKKRQLMVSTARVKGMKLGQLHDLVNDYWAAWHARKQMQEM